MNEPSPRSLMFDGIRVIDDDHGNITVRLTANQGNNKLLRSWTYLNGDEQAAKMKMAREFIEGWCDGMDHFFSENPMLYVRWLHDRRDRRKSGGE